MGIKGALNASAVLLSGISALLAFCTFVLSQFYSTATAEWDNAREFRVSMEKRIQSLEMESVSRWQSTSKDIEEINKKLDSIVEVKLRGRP